MKKLIYIFSVVFLALFACQDEILMDNPIVNNGDEFATLTYTLEVPDYRIATKSDDVLTSLYLMTFDENGTFLGRVDATNSISQGQGKARVKIDTRSIHFVANYDWSGYNEAALLGQPETAVMPTLTTTNHTPLWGNTKVNNLYEPINVELIRSYAKISLEKASDVEESETFDLIGFALGNYPTTGSVVTFGETAANSFIPKDEVVTEPTGFSLTTDADPVINMNDKFIFETNNYDGPTASYMIIKLRTHTYGEKYYKIHFLKSTENQEVTQWKIERNFNYRVIIKKFETDPYSNGSPSFAEAMKAAPANNLYAEIVKDSPIVSNMHGESLEVLGESLTFLFTLDAEHVEKPFEISTKFTNSSSLEDNSNTTITIISDEGILKDVDGKKAVINNGVITGTVLRVLSGQKKAVIRVTNSGLSRFITIISSERYSFATARFVEASYTGKDADVTLEFNIPSTFPEALLPTLKCYIEANKLYPVGSNQNMLISRNPFGDEPGKSYYVYDVPSLNKQTVTFRTHFWDSDETVRIVNPYFETANINVVKSGDLAEMKTYTFLTEGSNRTRFLYTTNGYSNSTINGNNIQVAYNSPSRGSGTATITTSSSNNDNNNRGFATGTIVLPADVTSITVLYSSYSLTIPTANLTTLGDQVLRNQSGTSFTDRIIGGTFQYQTNNSSSNRTYANITGTVDIEYSFGGNIPLHAYVDVVDGVPTEASKVINLPSTVSENSYLKIKFIRSDGHVCNNSYYRLNDLMNASTVKQLNY